MWVALAFASALFAGLTSILAKCGIKKTDSNVATAIRTIVVLIFSWIMVFIVGAQSGITAVNTKTWMFLIMSGFATGASWLCYFRALQIGDINKVVPIDKSSTILSILLAFVFLHEEISFIKMMAVFLIGIGTYLMIQKKKSAELPGNTENTENIQSTENTKDIGDIESIEDAENTGNTKSKEKIPNIKKSKAVIKARNAWFVYAVLSAVFAALTSILGKIGIEGVDSNLGTAIRTSVVLIMAWVVVFVTGKQNAVREIPKKELAFICLSGLATGGSWLCYYKALQDGLASVVVSIDKLSILVTIAFSYIVFHEKLSKKAAVGLVLIVAGTLSMLICV